jgi:hypothetical protein
VTVPECFRGAWARRSIALGDGPATEPASVIWVQGESAYADLRLPFDPTEPTECFAGHTTWTPPLLRWGHDIDLAGGPAAVTDVGRVEWSGRDLIERGDFVLDGEVVPYVEVWHRLPGSDGPIVEEVGDGLIHVVVGEHELLVVDRRHEGFGFAAEYRRKGLVELAHGDLEQVLA